MTPQQVYNTSWLPEVYSDKTGRILPISIYALVPGASGNLLIITGVAGKTIRILGGFASSAGIANVLSLKSGNGGLANRVYVIPANGTADPNVPLTSSSADSIELLNGLGLYVDSAVATNIYLSLTFVLYTP